MASALLPCKWTGQARGFCRPFSALILPEYVDLSTNPCLPSCAFPRAPCRGCGTELSMDHPKAALTESVGAPFAQRSE